MQRDNIKNFMCKNKECKFRSLCYRSGSYPTQKNLIPKINFKPRINYWGDEACDYFIRIGDVLR